MKPNKLPVLLGLFAIILSVLACGGSFSTANIADAWMSSDQEGAVRTTSFGQDQAFFAQVDLKNAPEDTVLKGVWIAVSVPDTDPNFVVYESEITTGDGIVYFTLTNTNLWPSGSYKIDLYMNGELSKTLTFEVR